MHRKIALVAVLVLVLGASALAHDNNKQPTSAKETKRSLHMGIGAKYLSGVPFLILNGAWGNFGAELGAGLAAQGGISLLWYSANGKYYILLPVLDGALRPYLGGGLIGLTATASTGGVSASISATGGNAFGGLEFSFASFGVPITIFSGANWLFLGTYGGQGWHVGLRWDF